MRGSAITALCADVVVRRSAAHSYAVCSPDGLTGINSCNSSSTGALDWLHRATLLAALLLPSRLRSLALGEPESCHPEDKTQSPRTTDN
mmetsp:Transcript_8089/g.25254  ORF Transcript_8089/g.25254 Transcript_8089/m.25254 type:complete len:89 (-) Transcript_8089:716-982(-)